MKKKSLLLLIFVLSLSLFSAQLLSFALEGTRVEIKPGDVKLFVGCNQVKVQAFNINGYNYFKLRDLAMAVSGTPKQFDVTWNDKDGRIDLLPQKSYTPVGGEMGVTEVDYHDFQPSAASLFVNNYKVIVNAYTIGGNNYYKLRDITAMFNIRLNWDAENKIILIDPSATGRPN